MVNWMDPEVMAAQSGVLPATCESLPNSRFCSSRLHKARALRCWYILVSTVYVKSVRGSDDKYIDSWEFVISLEFDWSFVTRKRRFRWPMVRLYAVGFARYLLVHRYFISLIAISC